MTEISGKSLHEIYKEDARKYKESIKKGRVYSESADNLIGNFDKTESLTVTMPMEEFDKLEKLALSAHTDKLSVEKLQEQLDSKVKALTEIRANIEEHNQIYDLSTDTALLLEGIDGIAFDALAAIGGDDD